MKRYLKEYIIRKIKKLKSTTEIIFSVQINIVSSSTIVIHQERRATMRTVELDMRSFTLLRISEEDYKEGVIIKFVGDMPAISERNDKHIRIYLEDPTVHSEPVEDRRRIIPGHPNCRVGDCDDCHNVACGIYQGYETVEDQF